jgi:hypothetical protein
MAEKETVFVLCDNGAVMPHDLPLPSGIADRVQRGDLRLVNEDGTLLADPAEEPPVVESPPDPDAVPTGTIDDVLAWVGDDNDRAARALEAEQAKGDQARSTLVAKLTAMTQE